MDLWLTLLLVWAIIIAFLILIPNMTWLRRVMGYMLVADIIASMYVISTYAATGTFAGMTVAIFAAVGISVTLRAVRYFTGVERLEVDGDASLRVVAAELLTQAARWIRSGVSALWKGGRVDAPPPLNVQWVREESLFSKHLKKVGDLVGTFFANKTMADMWGEV